MTLELLCNWTLMLLKNLFVLKDYVSAHQAWLDPVNLPSGKSSSCDFCGNPLRFVLQVWSCFSYNSRCTELFMFRLAANLVADVQVYAPIRSKETAYHRTLFVFMCPSMACLLLDQHEQEKDRTVNPKRR